LKLGTASNTIRAVGGGIDDHFVAATFAELPPASIARESDSASSAEDAVANLAACFILVACSVSPALATAACKINTHPKTVVVRTVLTGKTAALAVMCSTAEQITLVDITRVRPPVTRYPLSRLPQHRLLADGAQRHSKRAVLARRCRPPSSPRLREGKLLSKPGPPQTVPGGLAVACVTGHRVSGEFLRGQEGEDAHLRGYTPRRKLISGLPGWVEREMPAHRLAA
jgi:hypothetical protein